MTTAAELITDAFLLIRSNDPGEALEEYDFAQGKRVLNRMMRRWEANGLALGWQDVTETTDVIPAPPEAEEAIIYNLAVKLRAVYGATLEEDVLSLARDGYKALLRDVLTFNAPVQITNAPLPSNGIAGVRWNIQSDSPY
jgi:hypothetical protein